MNSDKKISIIPTSTMHVYDLPVIEYNFIIPENCTKFGMVMIGGGSSASFDGEKTKGGGSGGEISIEMIKPVPNDVINVKLGLGGKFEITKDNEICNSNSGQDSEVQINGKTIAIARGSYSGKGGTYEIFNNDDNIQIKGTNGKESINGRAITSANYFYMDSYYLNEMDGCWGDGGLGKRYNNGGIYLGAGGGGRLTLYVNTTEYTCFECRGLSYKGFPQFVSLELLQAHQQEMHNS